MPEAASLFALRHTLFLVEQERAHGESTLIEFSGRDRLHAQRKAVDWWFCHRHDLGLRLHEFFSRCRFSHDERTITFVLR